VGRVKVGQSLPGADGCSSAPGWGWAWHEVTGEPAVKQAGLPATDTTMAQILIICGRLMGKCELGRESD